MTQPLPVKSALRTLALFEAFGKTQRPLSLSELARAMGVPVSSCHALVQTLQGEGYLYSLSERRRFYPTKRLFDLAGAIIRHDPVLEFIGPHLQALRDRCGETVILGKRQELVVIYLDVIEGPQTIRYSAKAGERKPLHSSAIGKAMLGELSGEELKEMIAALDRPAFTPHTITDPKTLVKDLKQNRRQGFFVTRGENIPDVWAIARTVHIAGEALGVAIAGPTHRMQERFKSHVAALSSCTEIIDAETRATLEALTHSR